VATVYSQVLFARNAERVIVLAAPAVLLLPVLAIEGLRPSAERR
jgi:hypothetical protein